METLPLIAMFAVFLSGNEPSVLAQRDAQAISNGGHPAAALSLCPADEWSSPDAAGASAAGILGEEEDSDDRDLFDTGQFGVLPLVVPHLTTVYAGVQPRNRASTASPTPLRC